MQLFLFKLLSVFILPLGTTIGLFLFGTVFILRKQWRLALSFQLMGIVYLGLASTPFVADYLCRSLESQIQSVTIRDAPVRDVIVVLGGILGQPLPPRTEPDLGEAADRILTASRLYRAGKAGEIIVAAGNLPWAEVVRPEAVLIKELLIEWGVSTKDILLDTRSRNSYENGLNAKEILTKFGFRNALLVTSAAHMPRALAVFSRVGVEVFPVPTDYQAVVSSGTTIFDWLPSIDALELTTMVIRERLGMVIYRLKGWVK